ncbi:putative 54S ribosomal protein L17, mitochondrial [Amylocarpus encephaloides]|uniref:Large ribosomal subunit protein mL46 n=1 Tax=Amylocarpus encephaloides TaxID=45428 RepID=A0A9P7YPU9_9HELO|nr:putative 54S ribosomal protein L17, mitochondrial [Amylocarpus encephaloides]
MTASSRGSRAASSFIRASSRHPRVCNECINSITSRRTYAVAAPVLKPLDGPPIQDPQLKNIPPVTASPSDAGEYKLKAGVLLSRPPLLTRTLTPFEKAFFFYQRRLNERLVMPFSRYFYFKKDTPADADWKLKAKDRGGAVARDLGGYSAYDSLSWNDELLVGDMLSEPSTTVDLLVKDSIVRAVEGKDGVAVEVAPGEAHEDETKVEQPLERVTNADQTKDLTRLDRELDRTLYLVVQRDSKGWGFPAGEVVGRENLHQAAERIIVQAGGINMNTWIVGNAPIGHHVSRPFKGDEKKSSKPGEKTFFMKGRIMAGQANLINNSFGLTNFKWLTREEIKRTVNPKYWNYVEPMLAER